MISEGPLGLKLWCVDDTWLLELNEYPDFSLGFVREEGTDPLSWRVWLPPKLSVESALDAATAILSRTSGLMTWLVRLLEHIRDGAQHALDMSAYALHQRHGDDDENALVQVLARMTPALPVSACLLTPGGRFRSKDVWTPCGRLVVLLIARELCPRVEVFTRDGERLMRKAVARGRRTHCRYRSPRRPLSRRAVCPVVVMLRTAAPSNGPPVWVDRMNVNSCVGMPAA